ncbi:MAG: 3-hydroxyacyl-ACP dehydratase FabZ, partial [Pseudomonadota bacterium]
MSATLEAMDIAEILRCLPHRYPFLLVDRLYDIKPFKSCRGIKNVTINEQYFMGHFPEQPIMPGVLIVESMAQTAGAMLIKSMGDLSKGSLMYFLAMDEVKFRKPV